MNDNQTKKAFGPYSPVRQVGNFYFVSGQVGVDMSNKLASTDVRTQTKQALTNLRDVLEKAELTLGDVVKTTVFVTNMDDFNAVNEEYVEFFNEPRPARSCVAVQELPRVAGETPLKVEVEAVAWRQTT